MSKHIFLILIISLFFSKNINAQQEMGLHFMDIFQSGKTNPAYISDQKILIGLPNLHFNYHNTGGTFNQLILDYIDTDKTINAGNTLESLEEKDNILRGVLEIETISLGYRLGNIQLGFSHAQKTNLYIKFPKTLAKLFFEGNAQYVGENIDLSHDLNLMTYNEFTLSGALEVGSLTVGARAKYLTGISNASVGNNQLQLLTDDDVYQLTLTSDYELNTSSLLNADDVSNFSFSLSALQLKELASKNSGFAVDLGATYQVNEKLKLSASVIDLGQINWSEKVNNYSSKGQSTFDGFEFTQFSSDDSTSFGNVLDTLQATFDFTETNKSYKTSLPMKIYISGTYRLNEMWQVGGLLYSAFYRGQNFPVFALSGNAQITELLSVGGVYSVRSGSAFNLGLNFAAKLGPVQVYGTTDNINAVFQPYKSNNVNFRTGVNLMF